MGETKIPLTTGQYGQKREINHGRHSKYGKRGPEEGFTHEVFDSSFLATVALPASALLSMSLQLGEPQRG